MMSDSCKTYLRHLRIPEDMLSRDPSFFLLDIRGLNQSQNVKIQTGLPHCQNETRKVKTNILTERGPDAGK